MQVVPLSCALSRFFLFSCTIIRCTCSRGSSKIYIPEVRIRAASEPHRLPVLRLALGAALQAWQNTAYAPHSQECETRKTEKPKGRDANFAIIPGRRPPELRPQGRIETSHFLSQASAGFRAQSCLRRALSLHAHRRRHRARNPTRTVIARQQVKFPLSLSENKDPTN